MPVVLEGLRPVRTFDAACRLVLDYLTTAAPMGLWAVTRVAYGTHTMLVVEATDYPVQAGHVTPFQGSMCEAMMSGRGPQIAPDVTAHPAYASVARSYAAQGFRVGAYVGVPIVCEDGELFGTVCGFATNTVESLPDLQPLLAVFSGLLSAVLDADTAAAAKARDVERALLEADVDVLTGLLNRRGWERLVAFEEDRFRRLGDPATVVIIDLDGLKTINDRDGHAAGDRHLQAAAAVLRQVTRDGDVIARIGGDEFALLLIGVSPDQAAATSRRTETALDAHGVAASVGHAPYNLVTGFPGAIAAADQLMYRSKGQRRNNRQPRSAQPASQPAR